MVSKQIIARQIFGTFEEAQGENPTFSKNVYQKKIDLIVIK